MNTLRAAVLAATSLACLAGATEASAQRYFARERLVPFNGQAATTPDPTPTPEPTATPTPTQYNAYNYTVRKNTKYVNGCGFNNDATQNGFADWKAALAWCQTIKVQYPNNWIYCTMKTLQPGNVQANVSSSQCQPTFGGANWATGDDGHYMMQYIASAYAAK